MMKIKPIPLKKSIFIFSPNFFINFYIFPKELEEKWRKIDEVKKKEQDLKEKIYQYKRELQEVINKKLIFIEFFNSCLLLWKKEWVILRFKTKNF